MEVPVKTKQKNALDKLTWSWAPKSERDAGDATVKNLLLHWFPAKVKFRSLAWSYSFWLGTISATLFGILSLTGVILMFLYVPSVERAYQSVKDLDYVVSFGRVLRNSHRMAAHLMVAVVFLHMVRVFLSGAYKRGLSKYSNRPLNWIIGMILLLLTFFLSFTGYLLPWDQLAYWAITVGTNIARAAPLVGETIRYFLLGGNSIGQSTLIRFYVLHCFFLPTAVLFLFAYHMWRIRKDGGLASVDALTQEQRREKVQPPKSKTYSLLGLATKSTVQVDYFVVNNEQHEVNSSPHLTVRLLSVMLLTTVVVLILSLLVPAPLEEPANPAVTPNPAKAPWYFLWLQEIVTDTTIHIGNFTINGALMGGILLPGLLLLGLALWPYFDKSPDIATGIWFHKARKWQNIVFLVLVLLIVIFTIIGTFLRGPYWQFYWPWETWPQTPVPL
jgi:quinol-cytochrome oxidoreductase complex cytochrome b subunit